MQQLRSILEQNLKTEAERLVYELSDGNRSTREIAVLVGLGSKTTVSVYWEKWTKLGIVQESGTHEGRYERVCSLGEVGMELPKLPEAPKQTPTAGTQGENPNEGDGK